MGRPSGYVWRVPLQGYISKMVNDPRTQYSHVSSHVLGSMCVRGHFGSTYIPTLLSSLCCEIEKFFPAPSWSLCSTGLGSSIVALQRSQTRTKDSGWLSGVKQSQAIEHRYCAGCCLKYNCEIGEILNHTPQGVLDYQPAPPVRPPDAPSLEIYEGLRPSNSP